MCAVAGRWLWLRAGVDLLLLWAACCAVLGVAYFLPVEEQRQFVSLAVGVSAAVGTMVLKIPNPTLMGRLRPSVGLLVVLVISLLAFGVAYGDSRGWDWMVVNSGFMAVALVPLVWLVQLTARYPILWIGALVPGPCLVALAWHFLIPDGGKVDYATLPLAALVVPLLVWALVLVGVTRLARWNRGCPVWGSLTECGLMLMVFAPSVALAVWVPDWFGEKGNWQAGSILVVSLLLSNVVAVPLRQLVLELAKLQLGKAATPNVAAEEPRSGRH